MEIIVRGKNLTVTPALKEYAEKRVSKFEKFFEGELNNATVLLSVEKDMQKVEVSIPLQGYILRGEEQTKDMYNSIDNVIEKLERQVRKYKTRINKKIKNLSVLNLVPPEGNAIKELDLEPKIKKTKRFPVKPMIVEEAVLQMDLLGHNFYVFLNGETDEVNVVYKRNDGHYGLIEPDLG
ncbi:SSU ribosomal protein S30P [Desulfonispora thiosulfatigenes DSM 11270]|uniref:Ribosome hibernation promoting factor n=1 Tax=Desulfonispora thiosulfatigenes DSM 11270 TaxID=656914 RepID=A0A1W1UX13_DESTI|nr:ribosome-associated translation inhibitor RaiA [Desulfonispora thiosulfatigenes]SMB85705.1 SSU ribosomal protein S30P [Desulfonispora thiosulfatigenes DSM 11270]